MNKPVIAVFCKGNEPTADEFELMRKYALLTVVAYNVSTLSDSDFLTMDGVCGAVPERFADYPTADEVAQQYDEYLGTLGLNVGGKAPESNLGGSTEEQKDNAPKDGKKNRTGFNQ